MVFLFFLTTLGVIIMAFAPSSPVTGGPQTGFTSPTYTLTSDTAPDATGRQYAVTTIGGTQSGVNAHSASSPFTITMFRPKVFKTLSGRNGVTGEYLRVGKNQWKFIVRKGTTPAADQPYSQLNATLTFDVPSGSDTYDSANVRAALSLLAGVLWESSSDIGDSITSGIL
jgi:hypothetical protein